MNVNKEQDPNTEPDLNIEDEPTDAAHQDGTVSDHEDATEDLIDFPPPPPTLDREDNAHRPLTTAEVKDLCDHIKNRNKTVAGQGNGDDEETEVEPPDETIGEYYDSDMDLPADDSDADQCCMSVCMLVLN